MRTWDLWNRYFDNNNKPLHGCIQFMVKDGNTVAPIYDTDGTPLPNPIITDIYGRTEHQVCIDSDVVAYFYKYIGNGNWSTELDIDTSDTSKWALQYTSESDLSIDTSVESRSTFAVLNIEELRDLNADDVTSIDGVKIVTLMGYNEVGDKEPINYIWDANSTEQDDGGAVIATDLIKGRWIMVCPTEHLDVRHYGVFPSDSQNMLDQTIAIQSALVYANNHGLRLFFDTLTNTQYYHYYKLTNITLNPVNEIDVAKGVTFIDDDVTIHSQQTKAFSNDPYFLNGDTALYSNYAKASWNIKTLDKSKSDEPGTYIIDSTVLSTSVKTLQGWDVAVYKNISEYTFVKCNISGDAVISSSIVSSCILDGVVLSTDNSLQNLTLTEKMFSGSPMTQSTVIGCIADIDDFSTKVKLWNYLHYLMSDNKDIDFKYVTIPDDFAIQELDNDRSYTNFIGTGTFDESDNVHTYRFTNVRGNITVQGNANNTYIFDNCEINLTVSDTDKNYTISINNSTVTFNDSLPNSTIIANSSTVSLKSSYNSVTVKNSSLFGSTRLTCSTFAAYSSAINQEVSSSNLLYKDSQINKDIYSTNDSTSIISYIDNCVLNNIQHHISSDTANTVITGSWTNNNATKANPIVIDMTNIVNNDGLHNYKYENNTGTFIQKTVHMCYQLQGCFTIPREIWSATIFSRPEVYNVPHLVTGPYARPITDDSNRGTLSYGVYIPVNWQPDCQFFSIGLATRRIKLTVKIPFKHAELLEGNQWYNNDIDIPLTYTYADDVIATGMNGTTHKLTEFHDRLLVGPQVIPYSYNSPAAVPTGSSVIPPAGASNHHFNIEIEIF